MNQVSLRSRHSENFTAAQRTVSFHNSNEEGKEKPRIWLENGKYMLTGVNFLHFLKLCIISMLFVLFKFLKIQIELYT